MDFSKSRLFDGITDREACDMMACFGAEFAVFRRGEIIRDYSLGGDGKAGVLTEGRASVIRTDEIGEETLLEVVDEGGIFGEPSSFARSAKDSVRVVAETACEAIFIKYDQISKRCPKACPHHSRIVLNLLGITADKTRALGERIELLSCRTIRGRLLRYFSGLREKSGERFSIPVSNTRLAEYLCADRSAMVREMGRITAEGIAEIKGGAVYFPFSGKTV